MRRFGIFMSSEKYKNYPDTPFCHSDAELLRKTLIDKCDYPEENCLQLKLNIDDDIGSTEILKEIDKLIQRTNDGDTILLFYAGHGQAFNSQTHLILPNTSKISPESTSLKLSDVTYYLSKNNRLNIRIFDCCHSGEDSRAAASAIDTDELIESLLQPRGDGSITLASCAIHENSYWDDAAAHGVFTSSLVSAIESQAPGTEIYAETLKVDVCNAVKKWCEPRGKIQTPTLTIHLAGNIPIALRRIPEPVAPTASATPSLPLTERLAQVRAIEIIKESFFPVLNDGAQRISEKLKVSLEGEDFFGVRPSIQPIEKCDNIPQFLKEKIVVRMKSWTTMHSMEVIRTERERPSHFWLPNYNFKPIYDTSYYLEQDSEMPGCYISAEASTDGYVPGFCIFLYVCPLQASIALLYGYYFNCSFGNTDKILAVGKLERLNLSLDVFKSENFLDVVPTTLCAFKEDLKMNILKRLEIIEAELANARS